MIGTTALLLLLAAPQEPQLDKLVTFQHRAAPAHHLLRTLSEHAGIQLAPSRELSQELLVVDVKDVKLAELMNKLAWATHGAWRQSGGSYILQRPAEVSGRLRREERDAIVKGLREAQAALREKGAGAAPDRNELQELRAKAEAASRALRDRSKQGDHGQTPTVSWQIASDVQARGPAERALARIISMLDAQELLAIEPGKGVVFSSHPGGAQRPLPPSAAQPLRDAFAEVPAWNEVFLTLPDASPPKVQLGPPAGALLFVSRRPSTRKSVFFWVELVVLDSQLREVASATEFLSSEKQTTHGVDCPCVALEKIEDEGVFDFSDETVAMTNLLDPRGGYIGEYEEEAAERSIRAQPTPEQREFLLNPERYDLAGLGPSDALLAIKEKGAVQLVANLPDDLQLSRLMSRTKTANLGHARYFLTEGEDVGEEAGWMLLRPSFAASATALRRARSGEGDLLRTAAAGRSLSASQAKLLMRSWNTSHELSALPNRLRAVVDSIGSLIADTSYGGHSEEWIQELFETLAPPQMQDLLRGGGIPVARLSPAQQEIIHDSLFATGRPVFLRDLKPVEKPELEDEENEEDDPLSDFWRWDTGRMYGTSVLPDTLGRSYATEASVMLRNGHLPGVLQLQVEEEDVLFPLNEKGEPGSPTSLDHIAWSYFMKDDPEMKEFVARMPKAIKRGKDYRYTVTLVYPPHHSVQGEVSKQVLDPRAPTLSLDNLPPDMKKKLADLIEEYRKSYDDPPSP
jgi:hypothetical protein